jgi:hypothetical protein
VNGWGRSAYGDPCRECGFDWSTRADQAVTLVSDAPRSYAARLDAATGDERHPALAWPVTAYVCHVSDNLRIWAERLVGSARGHDQSCGGYDENALAEARGYRSISLPAALWSLGRAVEAWEDAVAETSTRGAVLVHPDRGGLTRDDVVVANAHDCFHHRWDIERSLDSGAIARPDGGSS